MLFARRRPQIAPTALNDVNLTGFNGNNLSSQQIDQLRGVPPRSGAAPKRRRGLFGGLLTPERLEIIGATLQQMGGTPGAIQGVADRREAALEAIRSSKMEDEQRRNFESAIGSLDPEMQPWARLAPEQAAQAQFRAMSPAERFGDLERIDGRLGQRNQLTGQYEWAPQVSQSSGPDAPAGYRYTPSNDLEAIPGGPADLRQSAEGRSRVERLSASARSLQTGIEAIDEANRILSQPGRWWTPFDDATGATGQMMRGVGGSRARDLDQALEPVRSILSFETLAEMRRNSETGGALGGIATRELELLGNTVRSLDTAQSRSQVQRNLQTVRQQFERTQRAVLAARAELDGGGPQRSQQEVSFPQAGDVEDGFRFRGGDPADPNNWEPVR